MGWIDDAKRTALQDVVQHLGIAHVRGRTAAPCPSCDAARRGSRDKRGPLNLHQKAGCTLWFCHRCDAGGDGLDAVGYALCGNQLSGLDDYDRKRVRAWFADRGWCEPPKGHKIPPRPPAPPEVPRMGKDVGRANPNPPPQREVVKLWRAAELLSSPAGSDIGPTFYLRDRGYRAGDLRGSTIVRRVPLDAPSFNWWPRHWHRSFRLLFPALGPDGRFVSLHARRVPWYPNGPEFPDRSGVACCENDNRCPRFWRRDDSPWAGDCGRPLGRKSDGSIDEKCHHCGWAPMRKTTWPREASATGLLFADEGGMQLLRGKPQHDTFLVVEGVTDLLRASVVAPSVPCGVIGFASGGASALGQVRWPAGARVGIATDADKAGDAYAAEAAKAMPIRPVRIRWEEL